LPDLALTGTMDDDGNVVQHSEWTAIGALVRKAQADTQATADAHDAKVREAAVRECITVVRNCSFYGKTSSGAHGYLAWENYLLMDLERLKTQEGK